MTPTDAETPGAGGEVPPAEPVSAGDLAGLLSDVAAMVASRPQEDFDHTAVFEAAVEATNELGEKITVADRRRRLTR